MLIIEYIGFGYGISAELFSGEEVGHGKCDVSVTG